MFGMIVAVTSATPPDAIRPTAPYAATDRYHHGDLPNALRCAAVDVIDERGLGGFSLREVARRAGVSHTAPAHHFGDVRGLLTSVATEGFDTLHRATSAAAAGIDDPVERLTAIGEAYVTLARSHHAHCEVMFRTDVVDTTDPGLVAAGMRALAVLQDTLQAIIDAEDLEIALDEATWFCWSAIQGLVVIDPKIRSIDDARGREPVPMPDRVHRFTRLIVAAMRGGGLSRAPSARPAAGC
jgi:AcrR family transcriptional regulator